MTIIDLVIVSVALAMDAVAVSIAQGLRMRRPPWSAALLLAGAFGIFQAAMPLLGWLLSSWSAGIVGMAAPWIAFVLLAIIGGHMIKEFLDTDEGDDEDPDAAKKVTLALVVPLAIATSIDALAVGVTFGVLKVAVIPAVTMIGVITFVLSLIAVLTGARLGERLGKWAELAGGIVLILIGLRILLDGLGVL